MEAVSSLLRRYEEGGAVTVVEDEVYLVLLAVLVVGLVT